MQTIKPDDFISRKKFYDYMEINKPFRELDPASQYLIIYEKLFTVGYLINNPMFLSSNKYELSKRQIATKENVEKCIKNKEVVNAYTEFLDYFDDYGAPHDDLINIKEVLEIKEDAILLQDLIEELINEQMLSLSVKKDKNDGLKEISNIEYGFSFYIPYSFKLADGNKKDLIYEFKNEEETIRIKKLDKDTNKELTDLSSPEKTHGRDRGLVLYQTGKKDNKDLLVIYGINNNIIVFEYEGKDNGEFIMDIITKTLKKFAPTNSFIQKIDAKIKELEDEEKKNKE